MMIHLASKTSSSSLSEFTADQVQPNAIDLRLEKVFTINNKPFEISEAGKHHRGSEELIPDDDGWYDLSPGTYEVILGGTVTLGPDEAGWVITRSTLNRNGIFLTSGLYDSGYSGVMAGAMHVHVGSARIKRNTRVGQFLLFKAEALTQYDGDYGTGKEHDKKYE